MASKVRRERSGTNRFLKAAQVLHRMSPVERIQMLVEAGLMRQEEADKAKARHQATVHEKR